MQVDDSVLWRIVENWTHIVVCTLLSLLCTQLPEPMPPGSVLAVRYRSAAFWCLSG